MYHVDNRTGVSTMPDIPPTESAVPQWFTEGGPGEEPTIPGSATWNIWQAELLNILVAAGVAPDKFKLNQIAESIGILIANGIEGAELLPGTNYRPRTDSLNNQQGAIEVTYNKDMNTCKAGEFGLYDTATCANSPPNAGPLFYCETKSIYATMAVTQFASAYDNNNGVMAWRNVLASATPQGSEWCEVYDSEHPPTPAGIGAQPADPMLTALAALVTAADKLLYFTGPDAPALTTLTAFMRALLDDTDAVTARGTLGAAPITHTHTAAQGISDLLSGAWQSVGAMGLMIYKGGDGSKAPGDTAPASSLSWSDAGGTYNAHVNAGTWRLLGSVAGIAGVELYSPKNVSIWMRIA